MVSILYSCVQISPSKQKYLQNINIIYDYKVTLAEPLTVVRKWKKARGNFVALISASACIRIPSPFLRNILNGRDQGKLVVLVMTICTHDGCIYLYLASCGDFSYYSSCFYNNLPDEGSEGRFSCTLSSFL